MTTRFTRRRSALGLLAGIAAASLMLTGCSGGGSSSSGASGASGTPLTIGTTDPVTVLDPAGSYDNGSYTVELQVFGFLFNNKPGKPDVQPDLAQSGEFTSPTEFTVKLKPGLKFANGDPIDSAAVKFSFDRVLKINSDTGPAALLANLDSVDAPDATTVVFHLKSPNDQTFKQVLSSPAGPIVDPKVFSATAITADGDIVKGNAFSGPYVAKTWSLNQLVSFAANPDYQGLLGKPKTSSVNVKWYQDSNNLKLDVQQGNIDVAYRSLTATDVANLGKDNKVKVYKGPGGEIRYIVFNLNTQPYGATTSTPDAAKALAVRQAVADSIDRKALSTQVFKGTYAPLYSYVPAGLTGANTALESLYGDGNGAPDVAKAKKTLSDAGVTGPVTLDIQYTTDHYGPQSSDEYGLIKSQLESTGLFKVNLQSTEYTTYTKERVKDSYPLYQLGWFPDFSDADNYLTPFFPPETSFLKNHFDDPTLTQLIQAEATEPDAAKRTTLIGQAQDEAAKQLSTLPLLQGQQVAVGANGVQGLQDTLDSTYKFRFGGLSK